jgi:hypothetical protein
MAWAMFEDLRGAMAFDDDLSLLLYLKQSDAEIAMYSTYKSGDRIYVSEFGISLFCRL